MNSQGEKRNEKQQRRGRPGTEMQYVHNWGSEVYHHGNSQKDFFLKFQPLVLSTPKRLLFTINLCISSEALLCPSICSPLLLFSPFCVSALNPSGLHHLVENSTILFTTLTSQKQHSWCFIMLISSKELGGGGVFFSTPSKLLSVATHRNKQKI